jgi:integrase
MTTKSQQLHKISILKALEPRAAPYWAAPIARGRFVGYRKIAADKGTWIARMRGPDGRQKYQSLGWATAAFDFDHAKVAAAEWFKLQDSGITATSEVATVADACRAYVKSLTATNGAKSGRDAELRLKRTVYKSDLGRKSLASVRITHVKAWRDSLGLKPENFNRTLRSFKAALNMAVHNRQCVASLAKEWNEVDPLPSEKKRRTQYLDLDQRQHLLAHCGDGSFRDFIEASILTGARGGELADAKRSQFDARSGSMTFIGKTRLKVEPRTVPISPAAVALFKRLAKGKKPDDLLLMRDESMIGACFCDVETRRFHGLAKIAEPVRWLSYDWGPMVKQAVMAADLPLETTHYTLRHSWISAALGSGMSTLDVARLTGTSLMMIEKHYGHLVDSAARLRLAAVSML